MAEEYKATINLNSGDSTRKKSQNKDKSFSGGLSGGLLGSLLGSFKSLLKPLEAISTLLSVALFPLLKPFLVLFIKVGVLLHRWLNKTLGGQQGALNALSGNKGLDDSEIKNIEETGKKLGLSNEEIQKNIDKANELEKKKNKFISWTGTILGVIIGVVGAFVAGFIGIPALLIAAIVGGFLGLVTVIFGSDIADNMINTAKENISKNWDLLKGFGTYIWNNVKSNISSNWSILTNFGTTIGESLTSVLETSFEVLSGIGQWIKDKITGFWDGLKSVGSWVADTVGINDGIVTPNGNVIRTNPSDYIIATKDPSSLGGSGSSNINVTINGGMITEDVASEIGRIIQRQTNYGGGY